ncbi:hypothetical protein ACKVWC_009904 [Pyricularia oryzae]
MSDSEQDKGDKDLDDFIRQRPIKKTTTRPAEIYRPIISRKLWETSPQLETSTKPSSSEQVPPIEQESQPVSPPPKPLSPIMMAGFIRTFHGDKQEDPEVGKADFWYNILLIKEIRRDWERLKTEFLEKFKPEYTADERANMLEKELAQQIAQFGRRPNESLKKYLERAQNLNFRLTLGDRDKTNRDNLALNLIMRLPDGTDGVTFQQRALDVLKSTGKMTWKGSFLTVQATFKNVYEIVESMVEGLTPHKFPDYTEFDEKDVRGKGEDLTILANNFGRLRINLHQAPPGAQDSGSARHRDDSWRQR